MRFFSNLYFLPDSDSGDSGESVVGEFSAKEKSRKRDSNVFDALHSQRPITDTTDGEQTENDSNYDDPADPEFQR